MCRFGSDVMRHFGMSMATRTARLRVPFSASVNVLLLAVSVEWIKSRAEWDNRAGWGTMPGGTAVPACDFAPCVDALEVEAVCRQYPERL